MSKKKSPENSESLEVTIEKVVFHSEENGFAILRVVDGDGKEITALGSIMLPKEGQKMKIKGRWGEHPKYGKQFKIEHFEQLLPSSCDEIEKYLASGVIKGIGPSIATRIVERFGEDTFDVFYKRPYKLMEVSGIGKKSWEKMVTSWQDHQEMHEALLFLAKYDIRGTRAVKIYQRYEGNLVAILQENPYRLALDIDGIGFLTADKIAKKMGIPEDSPQRIQAAIFHQLTDGKSQGHCFLPETLLISGVAQMLALPEDLIQQVFQESDWGDQIKIVSDEADRLVYLPHLFYYEEKVAEMLDLLLQIPLVTKRKKLGARVAAIENKMQIQFRAEQKEAILQSLEEKLCVITGGPGVGKTTIIRALVEIFREGKMKVALAAPTGRAAKRLSESSGCPASTIHRLLRYNPHKRGFEHNKKTPLNIDHLIIDETSMLDISLAYHLLCAIPEHAGVTFVGDTDQLPSVGPGNVLGDIIASGRVSVVRLQYIFRQAEGSSIVDVAHQINQGILPQIPNRPVSDICFVPIESPLDGVKKIMQISTEILPKRYNFDPVHDVQILAPMYRGDVGANNLNVVMADVLNPNGQKIARERFRVGDKVMQLVNSYEKDVYNGDMGILRSFDMEKKQAIIEFEHRRIPYEERELDEVVRAYAISIHKSQGSEYPVVIIPVFTQHFLMLERNLLYTAITRARRLVVLVGSIRALGLAVQTVKARSRYTRLANCLKNKSEDIYVELL